MARVSGWPALRALSAREVVRIVRQPSRVVGAVGTSLLLWVFLASGFGNPVGGPIPGAGAGYTGYLLPGMITLTVTFSAVFSALSLIEDRQAGFLQSALVSPAPRWAVIGAKMVGGAVVAGAQGWSLALLAPTAGLHPGVAGLAAAAAACALTAAAVTAMGLALAWWVNSSAGFHGVMNLVIMPMWLLSGAFFPPGGASRWMAWVMAANPLRWAGEAIRASLSGAPGSNLTAWVVTLGFAAGAGAFAWAMMGTSRGRGLGSAL